MEYIPPQSILLTKAEDELYQSIPDTPNHEDWREVADAMETLFISLNERGAIPDIRLRVFADPKCAEVGRKSTQEIFESNGTSGKEILRHPHFMDYLRYFIKGPDLPKGAIDGLCQILNEDRVTSGMLQDQCRRYVKETIRRYGLNSSYAATEYFRLALELGLDTY